MTTGLAIDLGIATVGVVAVTDRGSEIVCDPSSGENRWPCAVHWNGDQVVVGALAEHRRRIDPAGYAASFTRDLATDRPMLLGARTFRPVEQLTDLLTVIRSAAQRRYGRVDRVVVTIPDDAPPGDVRRSRVVAAAESAGFLAVELLPEAVAAVSAPLSGPAFGHGDLVLVYDLGVIFNATLVRIGDGHHEVIAQARVAELDHQVGVVLEQSLTCCRELLARVELTPGGLTAILPVGGGCRQPGLEAAVERGLGVPLRRGHADEPELVVVRGAACWLSCNSARSLVATSAPERVVPLSFTIPGGTARLLRWLVMPMQPYEQGASLARVRLAGGAIWELTASSRGRLDQILVGDGAVVASGEWLAYARH